MPSMQHFGFGPNRSPLPTPRPGVVQSPMPRPRPNLGFGGGFLSNIPPMPPGAPFAQPQARSMSRTAQPKRGGIMSAIAGNPNLMLALGGQLLAHRNDAREPMFDPAGMMLGTKADNEAREKEKGEKAYFDVVQSLGVDEATARAWHDAGMGEHLISSHLAKLEPGWRPAKPEELKMYGATAGQVGPDGQFKPLGQQNKPSALDQKIDLIMESGVDRETAIGIATGRIATSRHPVTGELGLIDKATGQPVGTPADAAAAGQVGFGSDAAPGAPAAPSAAPVADEIGDTADYPSAFGAEGVFKNIANVASDFLGGGQIFPDAAAARRQIENLNTQTATLLAEGTETRGGKYLIDRFDAIQAQAGGIQGPEDALRTLEEMKGLLQRAYDINQNLMGANVAPAERSKAAASLERLGPMIQEYDQVIAAFSQQHEGGGGAGPSVGTVEDGYRFKGGDPGDPNSWEKVN